MAQPYDTHDHQTSQAQPMVEELRAALQRAMTRDGLHADATLSLPDTLILRHSINMRVLPSVSLSK